MVDTSQYHQLLNYSGCGNTVSGNHPVTQRLIVDSLKMCGPGLRILGGVCMHPCASRNLLPALKDVPRMQKAHRSACILCSCNPLLPALEKTVKCMQKPNMKLGTQGQ
jgi:hypothetical protein